MGRTYLQTIAVLSWIRSEHAEVEGLSDRAAPAQLFFDVCAYTWL
jgi:hypothetical protein